tara:strand:- start:223 stop:474 length:252 start_codon:yes stop_codon:yes gene_type:complete
MELNAAQCAFIKQACESVSIKAADAVFVAEVLQIVNAEMQRLSTQEGINPATGQPVANETMYAEQPHEMKAEAAETQGKAAKK